MDDMGQFPRPLRHVKSKIGANLCMDRTVADLEHGTYLAMAGLSDGGTLVVWYGSATDEPAEVGHIGVEFLEQVDHLMEDRL